MSHQSALQRLRFARRSAPSPRALSSLDYLPGELEVLSVVVEADGSSCCSEVAFFAGSNSVLDEVCLKVRCLGVLECWKVRPGKLFGSTLEQLDGGVRVEGDMLDRLAFSSRLKDAVFQVEGCLARHIMGMQGDVGLRVSILYPANRAVMMPLGAGDPDIALAARDPPPGVADGPVVRCCVWVNLSAKHPLLAGYRISPDEAANLIRRTGKGFFVLGANDSRWACCLKIFHRDSV
jgi:hypothetical protein